MCGNLVLFLKMFLTILSDHLFHPYKGIFQMLLTLQERDFSPLKAPVGSGFY